MTLSTNGQHKASHGTTAPAPYLANPEAVIPRLIPNGQGRIVLFAGKGGVE